MKTHGDYKAQIDKLMGIKSQEFAPENNDSNELKKIKRQLRDEKLANRRLTKQVSAHEKKKGGT